MVEKKKKEKEKVIEGVVVEEEKGGAIVKKDDDTALVPSADNILKLADALFQSGMFQNVESKYGALAIIEYGRELGIQPVISLQTMSVVKGKICMEAKLMQAMAERSGTGIEILEKTKQICRIKFTKEGKAPLTESFTIEDAKRMGYLTKSNWQMFPEEMCFCRCISKGLRAYDPGSILGLYSREEMLDISDDFVKPAPPTEKKKPGPKPKAEPEPVAKRGTSYDEDEKTPEYQPPPGTEAERSYEKEQEKREEKLPPEEKVEPPLITEDTATAIEICMESLKNNYNRDISKLTERISSRIQEKFQFVAKEIPGGLTEEIGSWLLKALGETIKEEHLKQAEAKAKEKEESF